jgi:sRNA-binding protein
MSSDTLACLANLFSQCFSLAGRDRKPLKVGISNDLLVAKTDLSNTELRRALAAYTNSIGYLSKMLEGAARIDLDGEPAGVVTAEEARHAWAKMEALVEARNAASEAQRNDPEARWRAPVAQAPAPSSPPAESMLNIETLPQRDDVTQ